MSTNSIIIKHYTKDWDFIARYGLGQFLTVIASILQGPNLLIYEEKGI